MFDAVRRSGPGWRVRERMSSPGWQPFAPVNVRPDGRIFRKTRFDLPAGCQHSAEWMWVEVESLDTSEGILTNNSFYVPGLDRGARVTFELIPEGEPLAGCAVAVTWSAIM